MGIRRGACESSPNPREQTRAMSKRCARLWALLGTNSTHRAPFSISTTRNPKCWSLRFLDSRVYGNAVLPKRNSSEPHKSSARRISAHGCASSDYSLGPQYDKVDASRRIGTDRSEGRLCSDPVSVGKRSVLAGMGNSEFVSRGDRDDASYHGQVEVSVGGAGQPA